MKTKEIAFTLPIIIMLYEFMFFEGKIKKRILYLMPLLLTMLIIPLTLIGTGASTGEIMGDMSEATKLGTTMSRWDYLFTQSRVIVTYIRLLFLPINQNLDYDYPVYHSFFDGEVMLSFLFLLTIFGLGVYFFSRSRFTSPVLRLTAFGIFWFFITLSVESSVIPIIDIIFEHRLYLPSVGAFISIMTVTFVFFEMAAAQSASWKKAVIPLSVVMILSLAGATYARNNVWKDDAGLWKDVVNKSPMKARGHNNLGVAYRAEEIFDLAAEQYLIAIELKPDYAEARYNLGNVYLSQDRAIDKAIEQYQLALELKPDYIDAHNNLGIAYNAQGLIDKAIEHYQVALQLKPDNPVVLCNLGNAYSDKGWTDLAIEQYQIALRLNPEDVEVNHNLGIAYSDKGWIDKAIEQYRIALRLNPASADIYNSLGNAYSDKGLGDLAIEHYKSALRLNPDSADALCNLGIAYEKKGRLGEAMQNLQAAIKLKPGIPEAHYYLGIAYEKMGLVEEAKKEYQMTLSLKPKFNAAKSSLQNIRRIKRK